MEKLEVFVVQAEMLDKDLVLCVKLTDKWCKPLKEIGFSFDDVMRDQNKGIEMALWRFDPITDKKVDMMFDPKTQLGDFQQRHLKKFLEGRNK
jgi:hypothetical protein